MPRLLCEMFDIDKGRETVDMKHDVHVQIMSTDRHMLTMYNNILIYFNKHSCIATINISGNVLKGESK